MKEEFLNGVDSYLNYFGCLILGIFVAEKYFPVKPKEKDSFLHKFFITGTTTYAGALLGSYFYNLTYPDPNSGVYSEDDSEDDSEDEK